MLAFKKKTVEDKSVLDLGTMPAGEVSEGQQGRMIWEGEVEGEAAKEECEATCGAARAGRRGSGYCCAVTITPLKLDCKPRCCTNIFSSIQHANLLQKSL